jgi:restriction endonuclease S subunit
MSFQVSPNINENKVFLVKRSDLKDRFDPSFYTTEKKKFFSKLHRSSNVVPLKTIILNGSYGILPPGDSYDLLHQVSLLRATNLMPDLEVDFGSTVKVDDNYFSHNRARLRNKDVLIAVKGATIASKKCIAYVDIAPEKTILNGSIFHFQVKRHVNPKFVAYMLDLELTKRQMKYNLVANNAIDYLDKPLIYGLLVFNPSKEEQNKIVTKMDQAYAVKKRKEAEASRLLDSIDDYLLNELGVKSSENKEKIVKYLIFCRKIKEISGKRFDPLYYSGDIYKFIENSKYSFEYISEITNYMKSGFASGKQNQSFDDSDIIQIRPTNISNEREFVFEKNIYIDKCELINKKYDILQYDEVLFNNTNSQELVGKCVLFDLDGYHFCSNHITRLSINKDKVIPRYLTYILNLYQRKKVFFKICTNWNNQSGVNADVLGQVKVPVPPLEKQNEIATT